MWTSIVIGMAAAAAIGSPVPPTADASDSAHACCVAEALRRLQPKQTVTLVCRDGGRAKGEILGFDAAQGVVRFLPDGGRRPGRAEVWFTPPDLNLGPRALPAADITRVEWRRSGASSVAVALLGLLIGGLIGYAIGDAADTAPRDGWLDFSGLRKSMNTVGATAMGGALGASLGLALASLERQTHAVDCGSGPVAGPGQ